MKMQYAAMRLVCGRRIERISFIPVRIAVSFRSIKTGKRYFAGQANRLVSEAPQATLRGKVTVRGVVSRSATTNPVGNIQLYLLTAEAAKPFQGLQIGIPRFWRTVYGAAAS